MNKRKASTFRLTAKSLFLTYPKCSLAKEEALAILEEKVSGKETSIKEYLIANEKHADGSDHLHVYLLLEQSWNCKDPRFWDLGEHHGNYQGCRSAAAVKKYCTKENNWIASPGLEISSKKASTWTDALALAREGKTKEALNTLEEGGERCARDTVLHRETLLRTFAAISPITRLACARDMSLYPNLFEWPRGRLSLILFGDTNLGKTSLACSLLPEGLLTRHLDLLATYDPERNQGIILDDMSFSHLHDEAQIALLDVELSTQVHVRYRVANIPAGTPRILTSNRLPCDVLRLSNPAIARRVLAIRWLGWNSDPMWEPWG